METCPKCGKPGYHTVYKVRSKGKLYYYEAFIHKEEGKPKRCLIKSLTPKEAEELRQLLKAKKKSLGERVRELEEENKRLRMLLDLFRHSILLSRGHLEAMRKVYIRRKGYTPEDKELARVLHQVLNLGLERGGAIVLFPRPEEFNTLEQILTPEGAKL